MIKLKDKLSFRITILFILITFFTVVTLFLMMYTKSNKLLFDNFAMRANKIANVVIEDIDKETFNKLQVKEDKELDGHKKMRQYFKATKRLVGARYLYGIKKNKDGKYIYVIDGMPDNDENKSEIGDIAEGLDESLNKLYETGQIQSGNMEISKWGVLVANYYPIKDNSGQVIGALGVDYNIKDEYDSFKKTENRNYYSMYCSDGNY
ncbi:hypothetical protein [Clostridium novyi]|uniref:hypothetical protein n=1 Tax=Clostridium novyi TaxID=1542 RepID=UPI000A50B62E|nr:hypothetical protein [Clostridium novyi]